MSRTLSQQLTEEKNRKNTKYPWLLLLKIELNDEDNTIYRLVRNNEDVIVGGETYTRFSFELDITRYSTAGDIPSLTLRVNNIVRFIAPKVDELDGGEGTIVTLTVVNSRFLNEDYTEWEETFEVISTSSDNDWIYFVLGGPSMLRRRMPLYRYLAKHCRWIYGEAECGGVSGFSECNRTLDDCKERSNTSHFGGFYGLKHGGLKIV